MNDRTRRISSGSPFEEQFAYSRAIVRGDWCFVSGTTGYDYETMQMPDSVVEQASNAFATIKNTLGKADFSMHDVVRVQYTIPDAKFADEVHPALREYLADVRPAATMVVAGLIKAEMKIEIEVTAFRG